MYARTRSYVVSVLTGVSLWQRAGKLSNLPEYLYIGTRNNEISETDP